MEIHLSRSLVKTESRASLFPSSSYVKDSAGTAQEGGAYNRELVWSEKQRSSVCVCVCDCVCFGEGTAGVSRVKVNRQKNLTHKWECLCQQKWDKATQKEGQASRLWEDKWLFTCAAVRYCTSKAKGIWDYDNGFCTSCSWMNLKRPLSTKNYMNKTTKSCLPFLLANNKTTHHSQHYHLTKSTSMRSAVSAFKLNIGKVVFLTSLPHSPRMWISTAFFSLLLRRPILFLCSHAQHCSCLVPLFSFLIFHFLFLVYTCSMSIFQMKASL